MASSESPAKRAKSSEDVRLEFYEAVRRERKETQNTLNVIFQELSESLKDDITNPFTEIGVHKDLIWLNEKLDDRIHCQLSNGYVLDDYIDNSDPRLMYTKLSGGSYLWVGANRYDCYRSQHALFITRFPEDVDQTTLKIQDWYDKKYTEGLACDEWPFSDDGKAAMYHKTGLPFDEAPVILTQMFDLMWKGLGDDDRRPEDFNHNVFFGRFLGDILPVLVAETVISTRYTTRYRQSKSSSFPRVQWG